MRDYYRVLFLGLNYPPERTGISPYTGAMARGITQAGHAAYVLTAHPHYPAWEVAPGYGQWSKDESIDDVPVRRLRHYIPTRPSGIRRALSELSFGLRLATERWHEPDVIVAVSPALISTALAWRRAVATKRVPFVVWVQDLYSLGLSETGQGNGLVAKAMRALEGRVLRGADQVIVIHERFAERVAEDFGVPRSRIEVIRNWTHLAAVPPIDRNDARRGFGWQPDETIVLHAGNMGIKQDLGNVISAARLAADRKEPTRFVFLGGGSELIRLKTLSADLQNVSFLGSLGDTDFPAALQAADVLLVNEKPGVAEMAVPSKLTSYFAAGRPVLAATGEHGITAAEIRLSGAGLVVPAGDPPALLEGVRALGSDRELANRLGENGRRFRATVLNEESAIGAFDSLFRRLARASAPPHGAPDLAPRSRSTRQETQ